MRYDVAVLIIHQVCFIALVRAAADRVPGVGTEVDIPEGPHVPQSVQLVVLIGRKLREGVAHRIAVRRVYVHNAGDHAADVAVVQVGRVGGHQRGVGAVVGQWIDVCGGGEG